MDERDAPESFLPGQESSIFEGINRPIVIAHRGYSKEFPENTIVSFR